MKTFMITHLSGDGRTLFTLERTLDLSMKKKGMVYLIRAFRFSGAGESVLEGVRTLSVPLTDLWQTAYDDQGTRALIAGERGGKMILLDVDSGKVTTLFQKKAGVPGFRSLPVLWHENGKYFALGYFYDKEEYASNDFLVEVDLQKSGLQTFQKVLNMTEIEARLKKVLFTTLVPPDQGFFGVLSADQQELVVLYNGDLQPLDSGLAFGGVAPTRNRVVYAVKRTGTIREIVVRDVPSGRSWSVAKGREAYTYPFISRDGKVIVVALLDFKSGRMTYFYGREEEGFSLKPIPDLTNKELGTFRFSGNGKNFAFLSHLGIIYGTLPR